MLELREGMAIDLVGSVKRSCVEDNNESFESKISALAHLERNRSDAKSLQQSLIKLLETWTS